VNTSMEFRWLTGYGQTAGYSMSNIGAPTRGAASINPMMVFAS
jgi:hypothetical protein